MLLKGPKGRSDSCCLAYDAQVARESSVSSIRRLLSNIVAFAFATAVVLTAEPMVRGRVPLADAQQAQRVMINVARITQAEAPSRTRLSLQIGPQAALAKNSFIRIRGLPPALALSYGHSIGPGAWAVPLNGLPSLTMILPAGVQGQSDVAISLVSIEGAVLAEAKTVLIIGPASPALGRQELPSTPSPPAFSPAERERALALHAQGLEQLERGNVYAARKFFERAVQAGLAQSALALAGTYDPDELAKMGAVGLQPDVEAARKWGARARRGRGNRTTAEVGGTVIADLRRGVIPDRFEGKGDDCDFTLVPFNAASCRPPSSRISDAQALTRHHRSGCLPRADYAAEMG
jgi:hypothetical protein